MKKLFLFLAVAAFAVSCSSDDNGGGGSDSITFKANGTSKSMSNIQVEEESDGEGGAYLTVTGSIGGVTEIFTFESYTGELGADAAWAFGYLADGHEYYDNGDLNVVVETNNGSRIKGTFAGTMLDWESSETVTITDGKFDITY